VTIAFSFSVKRRQRIWLVAELARVPRSLPDHLCPEHCTGCSVLVLLDSNSFGYARLVRRGMTVYTVFQGLKRNPRSPRRCHFIVQFARALPESVAPFVSIIVQPWNHERETRSREAS